MKAVTLFLLVVFASITCGAQSKIVAQITNMRNDRGVCRVCLFDNAAAFSGAKGAPVKCLQTPVKNGVSEAVFENVPAGAYAVAVFHDANGNNQMDKNFLGIPKEGYGASRNKLPFAAAPGFDENKFRIAERTTTTLHIRLRNL